MRRWLQQMTPAERARYQAEVSRREAAQNFQRLKPELLETIATQIKAGRTKVVLPGEAA